MKFPVIILIITIVLHMHGITQLKGQTLLIETTCRNTSNYKLCISTLHASPSSSTADVAGLGLIMVEAVRVKAEEAFSTVDRLKKLYPDLTHVLDKCGNAYNAVLKADVAEAVAGLTKGVPKFAEFGMADAAWEAEICEGSYEGEVVESPMTRVNKDLHELAEIAVGIIRNLL
ncbi:hypothetical protein OROGR_002892 [Orobanche gracilis]